jgi:hypothetical protein
MAMTVFNDWLSRKLTRGGCALTQPKIVDEEFHRNYGPRSDYAQIVLEAEPCPEFQYQSKAQWPTAAEHYETAVLDAILHELLTEYTGYIVTKARFTLRAIGWHEVYSSPHAFYQVARIAARKIVDGNRLWPWEQS